MFATATAILASACIAYAEPEPTFRDSTQEMGNRFLEMEMLHRELSPSDYIVHWFNSLNQPLPNYSISPETAKFMVEHYIEQTL